MQRCGLCRFYSPFFIQEEGSDAKPSISIAGECRRFPGVIEVDENKWCGEYKSAKAATKAAGFTPPTIREIHDYCAEIDSSVSPVEFFNHYEAVKWMKGRSKMADWKAAIRGWTAREGE